MTPESSPQLLQSVLDALWLHIAILDECGTIVAVNQAWRTFAHSNGVNANRVSEGVNYLTVCEAATGQDADEARHVADGIRSVLCRACDEFDHHYTCHSPDEQRWFTLRVTRLDGDDPVHALVSHEPITRQKQTEEALRIHEELVRDASRIAQIGGWEHDPVTNGWSWTEEVARIHELPEAAHATLLLPWAICEHDVRARIRSGVEQAMHDARPFDAELEVTTADGHRKWVRIIGRPVLERGRATRVRGSIQDITNWKESQLELRQREAELAHLNRLHTVGELAGMLAHELNQPLYAINNYVGGIRRRLLGGAWACESLEEVLSHVSHEVGRAAAIVQYLRRFVRRQEPRRSTVHVCQLLSRVGTFWNSLGSQQGVRVDLDLPAVLPPVQADPVQLEQVLTNLLTNAVDALRSVPEARRRVMLSARVRHPPFVEVTVRDNGHGMSGFVKQHLFEQFFTTKKDGLGMGLAISRSIVESHGGKIWAEDNTPHGTTFHFTIPAFANDTT